MWCRLTSRVSDESIDALLGRADEIVSSSDDKETLRWAKDFFSSELAEDNNLDLLRSFHLEIWPEIANAVAFDVPVVDHAILLVKGAGATETKYLVRTDALECGA